MTTERRVIANRFEIESFIGQGGMGTVYRGRDLQTTGFVAIKALKADVVDTDPNAVERFHRESEALRRLDHPNIVKMLADIEEERSHYLVMEYVPGGSLADHLNLRGQLPIDRTLEIALDLADALTRAHRLKIIHRDIKPQNVLLAEDGSPRLSDFGVAHMAGKAKVTQTGALVGTVSYLSPEIAMGGVYDERSDIWAFGVVLYEMLTARRPFDEEYPAATLTAILNNPIPPLPEIRPDTPPSLMALLDMMLEKDPDARISSVRAVGAALENIIRDLDTSIVAASPLLREVTQTDASRFVTPTPPPAAEAPVVVPRRGAEPRVFVCYRPDDSAEAAEAIAAQLTETFGEGNVLKDINRLQLRTLSRLVLVRDTISQMDALVAVIGPRWATSAQGGLNDSKDLVRLELEAGLNSPRTKVFLVLVDGAAVPAENALPETLRALPRQETLVVKPGALESDMRRLTEHIYQHHRGEPSRRVHLPLPLLAVLALLFIVAVVLAVPRGMEMMNNREANAAIATVEPAAPGEYMVLVADFEPLGAEARDVGRFISENLSLYLVQSAPFSQVAVRRYPGVITSEAQAEQVAEANGAAVMVWGNYTPNFVEANVQTGATDAFPTLSLERDLLERTANVRIRLEDEREQSLAQPVVGILTMLQAANGDGYETIRTIVLMDAIEVESADIDTSTIGGLAQRAFQLYISDTDGAIEAFSAAIERDGGNPILFAFRSSAYQRTGRPDEARRDAQTAQRLAPAEWTIPLYLIGNHALLVGDLDTAIAQYTRIAELRPDDWFPFNFRGALHYLEGDYDAARADYEKSFTLEPNANFPYAVSALIALRQGRVKDAQTHMDTIIREFPDPSIANRISRAFFGDNTSVLWGPYFAAFTNLLLGQYDRVVSETERALELQPDMSDLYLLQGFAYCNLGDYAAAEAAYTSAIELDPDFTVLYLLRAEARLKAGERPGSVADMLHVRGADMTGELSALVEQGAAGTVTCENFFDLR
jgi:tetratricopeptide (TPR) repeat protein